MVHRVRKVRASPLEILFAGKGELNYGACDSSRTERRIRSRYDAIKSRI